MPNTPVPAAATGLPSASSSRRAFLGASIAVALAGSPAAAEAAECPAVLELARRRGEALAAISAAQAAIPPAYTRCLALWPVAPGTLRVAIGSPHDRMGLTERETDLDGEAVLLDGDGAGSGPAVRQCIYSAEALADALAERPMLPGIRRLTAKLQLARQHEARKIEALEVSGYAGAGERFWRALRDYDEVVYALAEAPARTLAGVLAKAEALAESQALATAATEAAERQWDGPKGLRKLVGLPAEQAFTARQMLGPAIADDLVRLLRSSLTS
ncbi:hypothetical protein [Phreatobacter sp.]|uniref:hypothetical protein n=1 Tax=Phreatobacter sp. TaxID=1966341 RepID=UPI003F6F1264